jgi:hypothetical protein
MQIRVVSSREEIEKLSPAETAVHLSFRPSNKDIFTLVETCPKLKMMQIAPSYMRQLSKAIQQFLKMQRIDLQEGEVWGHRRDINLYAETPAEA